MGLKIEYIEDQTPLDEDELEGLKIPSITTRGELDEFEQFNIEKAIEWTLRLKVKPEQFFTERFVLDLHKNVNMKLFWSKFYKNTFVFNKCLYICINMLTPLLVRSARSE